MALISLLLNVSIPADELELIARLKRKDPGVLGEIFDIYGGILQSVIQKIVHDRAVAEDLTQECFLKVWNRAEQLHERRGALGPWILMIGRNSGIDYLRSREGKSENRKTAIVDDIPANAGIVEELLGQERDKGLHQALNTLTRKQLDMIQLAFYKGQSHSEIALSLKMPLGTVKGQIRAALHCLRAEIDRVRSGGSTREKEGHHETNWQTVHSDLAGVDAGRRANAGRDSRFA